jgi:predicted transcriptional regulator
MTPEASGYGAHSRIGAPADKYGSTEGKEKTMLVRQVMQTDFFAVQPTESIQEAAKKMKDKHVGIALVLEENRVKGILTELEVAKAMAANADISGPAIEGEVSNLKPAVDDDGNRCCYFSDVQVDLLLNR